MVEYSAEPDVEKQEDETKTVDSNKQDMKCTYPNYFKQDKYCYNTKSDMCTLRDFIFYL